MDALSRLESRIHSLEQSRDRNRRAAWALALLLAVLSAAALVPQTQEELRTQRLVLMRPGTSTADSSTVLVAGPESSLVIQRTDGTEIARIGGPAVRPVR
jgi:hypothetical protein